MAKGYPYEAATMMLKGGTGLKYIQESIMEDVCKEPEPFTSRKEEELRYKR